MNRGFEQNRQKSSIVRRFRRHRQAYDQDRNCGEKDIGAQWAFEPLSLQLSYTRYRPSGRKILDTTLLPAIDDLD